MGLHNSSSAPAGDVLGITGDNSIGPAEIKIDLTSSNVYQTVTRQIRYTASTATTLYAQYKISATDTATFADRWISVQPIIVI